MDDENENDEVDLTTTQQLVIKAKRGDENAFTELYERHAGRVRHSVALRLGGYDTPFLEDIVQETFIYAFGVIEKGNFDETRSDGGFRNWLAKIAVNKIRDEVRKRRALKRGGGKERVMRDAFATSSRELALPSPLARPSEIMSGKEFEQRLASILEDLDERQRQIIDLRDHCQMSFNEIAEEMEGSPATLRSLYKRARERLRDLLEADGIESD